MVQKKLQPTTTTTLPPKGQKSGVAALPRECQSVGEGKRDGQTPAEAYLLTLSQIENIMIYIE